MAFMMFTLQSAASVLFLTASMILVSIFYSFRLFVIAITKICCFDHESVVDFLDAYFAADDIHGIPVFSLSPCLVLAGQVDLEYFNQRFLKTFILQEGTNCNGYAYNRFQQYPESFCGYKFWKWDRKFDLNNHIVYFNGHETKVNEENLNEIIGRDFRKPYQKERPLWEICIYSNFNNDPNRTLLVFRFHHSIMDCKSFINVVEKGFMDTNGNPPLNTNEGLKAKLKNEANCPTPFWRNMLRNLNYVLQAPIQSWRELKELDDENILLDRKNTKPGCKWLVGCTSKFNLGDFNLIKNSLGVTLSSLVLSGIAAGLNKYLMKYFFQKDIPAKIQFLNPAPYPGYPGDKMANYFTITTLNMSLGAENPLQRIETMNKCFLKRANAVLPNTGIYGYKILGLLPTILVAKARNLRKYSCTFSNICGPNSKWNVFGYVVDDFHSALPLTDDATALSFMLPSYNGGFQIFVTADKSCIESQSKVNELCSLITTELNQILLHFQSSGCNDNDKNHEII